MRPDQMDSVTNDYFMIENGKAQDLYFLTSFILNYFLKQKKGLWKRPGGGRNIRVPLRFDGNKSGFYSRGATISSDKKDAITAIFFNWVHAYGNGTVLRADELENSGPEAQINLVTEELYGAQESLTKDLAGAIYDEVPENNERLTGLGAVCNSDSTVPYGKYSADDIVSEDGTKVWLGKSASDAQIITLDLIRQMKSEADYGKGKVDEPDLMATTKTLFNVVRNILQVQQRFTTEGSKPVKAGFTGVHFEGTDIFPDRYCPEKNGYLLNSHHIGMAVHKKGMFKRTPWRIIQGTAEDKSMKIYWDGNLICNNRRAHYRHSNLLAS